MKWTAAAAAAAFLALAPGAFAQSPFDAGLRSVKIEATDWERSIAFYTALGMKPGTRRDTTMDLVWEGPTNNSGIVMTTPEYARGAEMVRGGTYLMITTPDVQAVIERLRQAGYGDVPQPRALGTKVTLLFLRDPDGNRIELMGPPAAE